jgi:hypothetical protein
MKHRHFSELYVSVSEICQFSKLLSGLMCLCRVWYFYVFHSSWLFLEPCDCYALLFVLFSWVIFRGIGFENYGLMVF